MSKGTKRQHQLRIGLALLLLFAFAALEVRSHSGAGPPRSRGDSPVYFEQAEMSLFDVTFFTHLKPPTTPAFYKILGRDPLRIARAQSALSVVCWFFLGLVLAWRLRSLALQVAAVTATCLLSLAIPINQYDWIFFSESLSLSLFVLVVGLSVIWVRFVYENRSGRLPLTLAWVAACLIFGLTRDSNIYLLATLLLSVALWCAADAVVRLRKAARPRINAALALGAVLLGLGLATSQAALQNSQRWKVPLLNVLQQRVLKKPRMHRTFVREHGLPRNREFESYEGRTAWQRSREGKPPMLTRVIWGDDPEVADIQQWIEQHGTSSYARYLLRRPTASTRSAFKAMAAHGWSLQPTRRYGKGAGSTPTTELITRIAWAPPRSPVLLWALLLIGGGVVAAAAPGSRLLGLVVVFLSLNAPLQAFVAFHGDTTAMPRHMLGAAIALRLAFLFLLAAAINEAVGLISRRRRSKRTASERSGP